MDKTAKERMKRYRNKKRNETPPDVTVSVTEAIKGVTPDVTVEHPVLKWLIPGEKRKKMELIVDSARKFNQLHNIYLGCGKHSLPLDIVGEMLECTQC